MEQRLAIPVISAFSKLAAAAKARRVNLTIVRAAAAAAAGAAAEPKAANKGYVVYVPGFGSTSKAFKAEAVRRLCAAKGFDFVSYDPENVEEMFVRGDLDCLERGFEFPCWFDDCYTVLDHLNRCDPPSSKPELVLVGSSMGGWICLKVLLEKFDEFRVAGMVLVAPAPNFLLPYYRQQVQALDEASLADLEAGKVVRGAGAAAIPLHKRFAESSADVELDLDRPLEFGGGGNRTFPIRILHGAKDEVVPFRNSLNIMDRLLANCEDVDVLFRKNSDHAFSKPDDIRTLEEVVAKVASGAFADRR